MRIEREMNNNLTIVYIGDITIYFSYETPVALWNGRELIVSENEWSRTTGKHLNRIDGGDRFNRIPHKQFLEEISKYKVINIYNKEECINE